MHALAAVGWTLLGFGGLLALPRAMATFRPAVLTDALYLAGCEAVVLLFVAALALAVHVPGRTLSAAVGLRPTALPLLVVGMALGLALILPANSITQAIERLVPRTPQELEGRLLLLGDRGPRAVLKLALGVGVLAPAVEELFFRGVLFAPLLRRHGPLLAVVITSLLFVMAHADWKSAPALVVVAFFLGLLRAASGSLLPSLAVHVVFNSYSVIMLVLVDDPQALITNASLVSVVGSWVVCTLLAVAAYQASATVEAARARLEDT